jgi:phage FluMu protein Com
MTETAKRLGRLVKCPKCKTEVNPLLIEFVPEVNRQIMSQGEPKTVVVTPSRDVVKCPKDDCLNLWYTVHVEGADHIR